MQSEYFEDHQDRRPGGSKQENSQDDHFLRPLTGRLDQVFAAEIRTAKIPFVTGETVPPTATRLKKAIRLRKFTLLNWQVGFTSSPYSLDRSSHHFVQLV